MTDLSVPNLSRRAVIAGGLALSSLAPVSARAQSSVTWTRVPGSAYDVGCGGGAVYVIGTNALDGGYGIYRWTGRTSGDAWSRLPGAATDIAVDDSGTPWVINDANNIYRWNGSAWSRVPGAASDISAGGGEVYVIGTSQVNGGYRIYRWNQRGQSWDGVDGGAVCIAVHRSGQPWVINDQGNIYSRANGAWTRVPGAARDIGSGGGEVYAIGTNAVGGGHGVYRYAGAGSSPWVAINGGGVRIAADNAGQPWVVNDQGGIFRGS